MDTKTLVVGQKVTLQSGIYTREGTVVAVKDWCVEVELLRIYGPAGLKHTLRFDTKGKACDSSDLYTDNMWGGPDPRIPGTHEFGPWELVEDFMNTNEYRMGAEADNSHILDSDPDPFPPMVWTGNLLSDCWRYVRVTAAVSWKLFRCTLGRIAG